MLKRNYTSRQNTNNKSTISIPQRIYNCAQASMNLIYLTGRPLNYPPISEDAPEKQKLEELRKYLSINFDKINLKGESCDILSMKKYELIKGESIFSELTFIDDNGQSGSISISARKIEQIQGLAKLLDLPEPIGQLEPITNQTPRHKKDQFE
jgi:hypothetical protein